MLKSCKYCGRYHDSKYDCGKRPKKIKIRTENSGFRSTAAWTERALRFGRGIGICANAVSVIIREQKEG